MDLIEKLRAAADKADTIFNPSLSTSWREAADEIEQLRGALQMWVDYDNLDEADFSEAGPMMHYAEAIAKARHLLNPSK